MNQQFKMQVTFNVYTYAANIYEAKTILSLAAKQFVPLDHKDKPLPCVLVEEHLHFKAVDEPFNDEKVFKTADEAYAYCSIYSDPRHCLVCVIGHHIDLGYYTLASELLLRLETLNR